MNNVLAQLDALYHYAIENKRSDLYRAWYKESAPRAIGSLADWHALPPIEKKILIETPFADRLFTPRKDAGVLRMTSGTSGGGVLIVPRSRISTYEAHFSQTLPSRCVLNFYQPHHFVRESGLLGRRDHNTITISGDPSDLAGSVALAARAGVDYLLCFAHLIELLIPHLRRHRLETNITRIEMGGEFISAEKIALLQNEFPNATIFLDYGATETQGIVSLSQLRPDTITSYTPLPDYYIEIVNEGHVCTEEGEEGEILITTLWTEDNPLPLLRYRTGDRGRITKAHTRSFQVLGRMELDTIKVAGGVITVAEVARVLRNLHPALTEDFELHFTNIHEVPHVEIKIKSKAQTLTPALVSEIAEKVATRMRVAPTFTYQDGTDRGLYAPLQFTPVTSFPETRGKRKRFIRHD